MARKKTQRGKRRASGPRITRPDKNFSCLECNREGTVTCTVDTIKNKGIAKCAFCEAMHRCDTNKLSQSIDVYADWVDQKEKGTGSN
ncbi:uncharacterized protein NEMAJ01_0680 [Nematocida major]|uniref:uncharacterized protein n=1 Tax=Nematocida major TaxID=1912982 RepID=UPI0020087628|nr:uncharacterized protein NEMAJ01_0680 [Nematocida major]KAH9385784.1 hypothetical protein NEMAJ01_0680 [Nematocida major]